MSRLPVAQVERLFTVAQAAELLVGAGEGNRTLMTSLEGCDYPLPD